MLLSAAAIRSYVASGRAVNDLLLAKAAWPALPLPPQPVVAGKFSADGTLYAYAMCYTQEALGAPGGRNGCAATWKFGAE